MHRYVYTIAAAAALVAWWIPANGYAVSFSEINRALFKQLSRPDSVQKQTNPFVRM